jgi:probable HAF family extracellular repeat protein
VPAYWARATASPLLLPTLGGDLNTAFGVNRRGLVVGSVTTTGGLRQAFAFRAPLGPLQLLGALGGGTSEAYDVNAEDVVTGFADDAQGLPRAFRWSQGTMTLADAYSRSLGSAAYGINNGRQIAGYYLEQSPTSVTALFDLTAQPVVSYRFKGVPAGYRSVNDAGVAVGYADPRASGVIQSFSYSPSQGVSTLPFVTLTANSRATDINSCGRVTGYEIGLRVRAVLWTPAGC